MMKRARGAKGKADDLFRLIVKRGGSCEARTWVIVPARPCRGNLECAHIASRSYAHTRCDERNAVALCSSHHRFFTDNPLDFAEFCEDTKGRIVLDQVRSLARERSKVDWDAEVERLTERVKELGLDED